MDYDGAMKPHAEMIEGPEALPQCDEGHHQGAEDCVAAQPVQESDEKEKGKNMTRSGTTSLIAALIVGSSAAYFFAAQHYSVRRAGQAIARADEYRDAEATLFEPRYLEAEKAVADVAGDPFDKAHLQLCLTKVNLSRDYLGLRVRATALKVRTINDGSSRQQIAHAVAAEKQAEDTVIKFVSEKGKCVAEAME
jgi:hypothetical protein